MVLQCVRLGEQVQVVIVAAEVYLPLLAYLLLESLYELLLLPDFILHLQIYVSDLAYGLLAYFTVFLDLVHVYGLVL